MPESYKQTLVRPREIMWNSRRKDCDSQGGQGHHMETTESTNLGSAGLTETEPPTREPVWD